MFSYNFSRTYIFSADTFGIFFVLREQELYYKFWALFCDLKKVFTFIFFNLDNYLVSLTPNEDFLL